MANIHMHTIYKQVNLICGPFFLLLLFILTSFPFLVNIEKLLYGIIIEQSLQILLQNELMNDTIFTESAQGPSSRMVRVYVCPIARNCRLLPNCLSFSIL